MIKSQWRNESEGVYQERGTVTSSNPASISDGATGEVTLAIPNIDPLDSVFLTPKGLVAGLTVAKAVITAGVVTVTLQNAKGSSVDDAASDYDYFFISNSIS